MTASPNRNRMFRQALSRRTGGDQKNIDRSVGFRARSPYPLFFVWGAFLGVSAYLLLASPLLDITEISVSGESRLSSIRLSDTVDTTLTGKRWHFFARRNLFFVPTQEIEAALRETYPLIRSVAIERVFPRRLEVAVVERPSLWVWCSGGPCYLVDEAGRAQSNDRALFEAYTPWRLSIIDASALPVHTDEAFEATEYFRHFEASTELFPQELGLALKREAATPSRYSHELRLMTDAGWTLLVNTEIPVGETLAALGAFLENRTQAGVAAPLLGVDARVPGKIFYTELNQATGESSEPKEAGEPDESAEKPKSKKKKEARD